MGEGDVVLTTLKGATGCSVPVSHRVPTEAADPSGAGTQKELIGETGVETVGDKDLTAAAGIGAAAAAVDAVIGWRLRSAGRRGMAMPPELGPQASPACKTSGIPSKFMSTPVYK